MKVQINKEGRTRYKRRYLFPDYDKDGTSIYAPVHYDKDAPNPIGIRYCEVAELSYKRLSIICHCPRCGLQIYGIWYRDEKFKVGRKLNETFDTPLRPHHYFPQFGISVGELWEFEKLEQEGYTETSKKIEAEIRTFRDMKKCPLCEGPLPRKDEYEIEEPHDVYIHYDTPECHIEKSFPDYVYDNLWVHQREDFPSLGNASTIQKIKDAAQYQKLDTNKTKVSSNPDTLKKYIKHLLNTEMTIQLLEKRLYHLYSSGEQYREEYIRQQAEKMSEIAGAKYSSVKVKKPTVNDVVLKEAMPIEPSFTERLPAEPIYGKPGLFNRKKVLAQNELLRSKYEADCQAYRRKKEEYDKQLRKYHSALDSYNRKKQEAFTRLLNEHKRKETEIRATFTAEISQTKEKIAEKLGSYALYQETLKEIQSTEEMLSQSYACLQSLYSCGIIYEKYHNPVALSSFYDYLAAERCTTLTGADGAYNIFENEVRLDLIITKLDVVISQLDQIRANQYTLYCEMSEMNKSLDELNRTASSMANRLRNIEEYQKKISNNTKKISDITEVIAHNTAVTAFYAKKTAELTDALGFMIALK